MAIRIIYEKCTLCRQCIDTCPFGAIEIKDDKLFINENCNLCGLCIKTCPENALEKEEKVISTTDLSQYKGIWFFAESRDGKLCPVAFEMLNASLKLKKDLGEYVAGVLIGSNVKCLASELGRRGADKVYVIEDPLLEHFQEETYATAMAQLIKKYKPDIVIAAATMMGRAFIPSVAARIKTGLTADCTDVNIDPETKLLIQTRPTFGGNLMARIICKNHRPQMATIRPKMFDEAEITGENQVEVITEEFNKDGLQNRVSILGKEKIENVVDLQEAELIVSGGRGVREPKNFEMIKELADLLGGAVGASRAAVDSGWIPYPHQVGQTGKTVKPKIYIACGISGAIQHLAGMQTSDYIIAINKDPDAPIFNVANLGLVGDIFEVIPALIKKIKENKGE
ncbi:MAG TPA: electron transfer flavoprotein subunit alpha [bacterium]|nr:electron transfer flavoprotein subunit alpha [bacterium]HPP29554.1 electron transfer flavoprotein subunit alpha [bacterium]